MINWIKQFWEGEVWPPGRRREHRLQNDTEVSCALTQTEQQNPNTWNCSSQTQQIIFGTGRENKDSISVVRGIQQREQMEKLLFVLGFHRPLQFCIFHKGGQRFVGRFAPQKSWIITTSTGRGWVNCLHASDKVRKNHGRTGNSFSGSEISPPTMPCHGEGCLTQSYSKAKYVHCTKHCTAHLQPPALGQEFCPQEGKIGAGVRGKLQFCHFFHNLIRNRQQENKFSPFCHKTHHFASSERLKTTAGIKKWVWNAKIQRM